MGEKRKPSQEIISLSNLAKEKLIIPPYQRPYKWEEIHVVRLLDDIFEFVILNKKIYRIGSIILHHDGGNNIVDGQQRLTTISLLLKQLDETFSGLLMNETYSHKISKENIVNNFKVIDKWLYSKFGDDSDKNKKKGFYEKICEKCEFVLFTVYNEDEAFQLFDSQNSRGKDLEPYDLLKAFHLREMKFDSEPDRERCVEQWEKSIDDKTLKPILGNHLFRIRKWSKNQGKYDFTKNEIAEFKGISLHNKQQYPHESALRLLDGLVENAQNDKFLKNLHISQSYPFSITMPIINGKRFFEYVDFYIQQKENMLDKEKNCDFANFYKTYCLGEEKENEKKYDGAERSGDKKVKNLYENILLAFVDKFGYIEDFENYYKAFYKAAYIIRCNNGRIRKESILNDSSLNIIRKINNATQPSDLKKYQYKVYQEVNESVKGINMIKTFIENGK